MEGRKRIEREVDGGEAERRGSGGNRLGSLDWPERLRAEGKSTTDREGTHINKFKAKMEL